MPAMTDGRRGGFSRTVRAALLLVLMAGFYVLALAIVAALASLFVIQAKTDMHIPGIVLIAAVIGIVSIVIGIVPRYQEFIQPGPRITREQQPQLFDEIRRVAEATGSPMPREVYIVAQVNAAVAHVGGWLGIGSRPIMMLGLPLIAVLRVSELRGVIAHEFGHFVGGETRLSTVIYRTREGIGRTIGTLERSVHWMSRGIRYPFIWYGEMYLRLTQAQSRRQELDADAMAARIAGGTSMESGLVAIEAAGLVYDTYLNSEVGVVVGAGFRPPLAEGFSRFLEAADVVTTIHEAARSATRPDPSHPYDSHPSLGARLSALRDAPHRPAPDPDPPAIELVRDTSGLEGELLRWMTSPGLDGLQPIGWVDALQKAWLPFWERQCGAAREALRGVTPGSLPDQHWSPGTAPPGAEGMPWGALVGAALAVLLASRGWSIEGLPGDPVTATRDGTIIEPFTVVPRLAAGELSAEEWRTVCRDADIAEVDLGPVGDDAST